MMQNIGEELSVAQTSRPYRWRKPTFPCKKRNHFFQLKLRASLFANRP